MFIYLIAAIFSLGLFPQCERGLDGVHHGDPKGNIGGLTSSNQTNQEMGQCYQGDQLPGSQSARAQRIHMHSLSFTRTRTRTRTHTHTHTQS